MLAKDFKEFIGSLNKNEVRYLIVGGYALGVHGYPRNTGDLDVWVEVSEDNAVRIEKTLIDFGFASLDLKKETFLAPGVVIQLGYPPLRIDIITTVDGVAFDLCYQRKKTLTIDGIELHFIGIDDLKTNKRATGRARDIDDIAHLP